MSGRLRYLWTLLALCAAMSASAQTAPDPDAFTRDMAARLGAARKAPVEVAGSLELRGRREDGEDARFYLDRIYAFCTRNTAEDCDASREAYVAGMVESGSHPPLSPERLRLVVRDAEYCRQVGAMIGEPARAPVTRPVAQGFCAMLVADYPRTRAVMSQEGLEKLKLTAAAAWLAAAERTREANAGMLDGVALDTGAAALTGGDYVSSVVLDIEGWRRLAARTSGDILMTAAAEGFVFVVRRDMIEDLAGFRKSVEADYAAAERGISPLIYRWAGDGWSVLE